jgi:formate hydrogenlyase subunit 3/multisubunit Na+/H+ antiporter MnhD subunit
MLALVRPDSWNFPLFLHVLGAVILVGSIAATALAAGRSHESPLLRRVAFWTLASVVLPAWALMRFAGQWIDSKEDLAGDPAWLGIGFMVGDIGLVVLLVTAIVGWWSTRRLDRRWPARTVTVLASLYLAALLVAMWAMSAKPD